MPEEGKEKKDVEMKDADKDGEKKKEEEKKEKEKKEEKPKDPKQLLLELIALNLRTIHAATSAGDARVVGRIMRSFANLRRNLTTEVLVKLLEEFVDADRPFKATFIEMASVGADVVMEEPAPPPPKEGEPVVEKKKIETKFPQFPKPYPPEFEAYALLLVLIRLIDKKQREKEAVNLLVPWLKTFNRRTLDFFNTRAYFYMSMAYERSGELEQIRAELLAAYRTACLRHDVMGQATLMNLVLRNYLAYNLYEQALKFVKKTEFPESRPNSQYARYLFYIGQIKAVQLEYSDSHSKLMQAIRKAPTNSAAALGFKLSAYKLAIIVELLTGGVPDRSTFMQKELRVQLRPYYAITQAVRSGDLNAFKGVIERHEALFKKDKTLTLINRLRYNVIKTGLRSINLSYSSISLKDICAKLGLESEQDAAGVVAKAIVDGVIDATIDFDNQCVKSQQKHDVYSSCEPQKAFHKRISFCLQMHNDTVKAMAYPDENDNKDEEDPEKRREREKEQLANIDDDGDDDDMLL